MEKGSEMDGMGKRNFFHPFLDGERGKIRKRGTKTNSILSDWEKGAESRGEKHFGCVDAGHHKTPFSKTEVLQVQSWASSSRVP